MMDSSFCISSSVLGTEKHLLCTRGSYSWVDDVPSYAWYCTGELKTTCDYCLDTLARLNDIDLRVEPPTRFVNAMATVMSGSNAYPPPWQHVMPKETHRMFVRGLIDSIVNALERSSQTYYRTVWVPGNTVVNSLKRAKVNVDRLNELLNSGEGNQHALQTFKPTQGGYANPIVYDRFGSRTGRLTVASGPSILTLKKEHRNIIASRYGENGTIVMLDFANLEPRVLLYEAGKRCDNPDLYTSLNDELFHGSGDRKVVKGAVISELYGVSKHTLVKNLKKPYKVIDEFTRRINSHFETKKLLKRVKDGFVRDGYILNRYGRRVQVDEPIDRIFVNSYAQSTGVDVAFLGFNNIIKRCEGRKVSPLFMLVDALVLDVHKDELGFVKLIKSVKVPGYVQTFPMTFSQVT